MSQTSQRHISLQKKVRLLGEGWEGWRLTVETGFFLFLLGGWGGGYAWPTADKPQKQLILSLGFAMLLLSSASLTVYHIPCGQMRPEWIDTFLLPGFTPLDQNWKQV